VAPGAATVWTGEAEGVGVAGGLNGVEDAARVAVGVGTCAEAVGVGVCATAAAAGVSVVVAVALAVAVAARSWASAMPPTTAAYRPAQQRAMARIFLSDKLALIHARGLGREGATPHNFGIGAPALEQHTRMSPGPTNY